jgi:hypothetical protein
MTYTAVDFDQTDDFFIKRQNLVCSECVGPAFYRRPERDGREACFVGNPHAADCNLATVERNGTNAGQGCTEDAILTIGRRLVVTFNQGTLPANHETQIIGGHADDGILRIRNEGGTTLRPVAHRNLRQILHSLITSEEFRTSRVRIDVPEKGEFVIADLFVNFSDVTEDHVERYHGFWGVIPVARAVANTLWFNSGGVDDMSVFLDARHKEAFYEMYGDPEVTVSGAYMLVFGELKRTQTGKKIVEITDPGHFTLRVNQRNYDIQVEWVEE